MAENQTATQADRLSRDYQQEQNDAGINDGLTDAQGNNVGVQGLTSSGNDFGATPEIIEKISGETGGRGGVGTYRQSDDDPLQPITDGGRRDEDFQDDDITSGGNAAGANGIILGPGSAAGGTGLGAGGYSSSAVMDDGEFDAEMRATGAVSGSSYGSGASRVKGNGTIDSGNGNAGTGGVGAGNAGTSSHTTPVMDSAMDSGSGDAIRDETETINSRGDLGSNGGSSPGEASGGRSSGGAEG